MKKNFFYNLLLFVFLFAVAIFCAKSLNSQYAFLILLLFFLSIFLIIFLPFGLIFSKKIKNIEQLKKFLQVDVYEVYKLHIYIFLFFLFFFFLFALALVFFNDKSALFSLYNVSNLEPSKLKSSLMVLFMMVVVFSYRFVPVTLFYLHRGIQSGQIDLYKLKILPK